MASNTPEDVQAMAAKVAAEVLQKVSKTLSGELAATPAAAASRQFVFTCPGDFGCDAVFHCTQNFHAFTQQAT